MAPQEQKAPKGFISPEAAAVRAGVNRFTVYGWVRRRLIKKLDVRKVRHPLSGKVLAVWLRESAVPAKKTQ